MGICGFFFVDKDVDLDYLQWSGEGFLYGSYRGLLIFAAPRYILILSIG